MKTLILTVGLPRSGKSTWAKEQGHPIVNPDSVRLELYGQRFWSDGEKMVWAAVDLMVRSLFTAGHQTVILDATNLSLARRGQWKSPHWNCAYRVFTTGAEECQKRAVAANMPDLVPVIASMERRRESLSDEEKKNVRK